MKYRIIRLDELMAHDALHIEAHLAHAHVDAPPGMSKAMVWRGLESGELLLLADTPDVALLKPGAQGEWLISERAAPLVSQEVQTRVQGRLGARQGPSGMGGAAAPSQGGQVAGGSGEAYPYPSEVIVQDTEPREVFHYALQVTCPPASLQRFITPHFTLAGTAQEREVTLMPQPDPWGTRWVATTRTALPRGLRVMRGGRCHEGLGIAEVTPQSTPGVVRERYLALMPTVRLGQRLVFPAHGYYYHFVAGRLAQEYEIVSGWAFARTRSAGGRLVDERDEGLQSALLVFDQVDGAAPGEQHLAYCPQRLEQDELDAISPEWLQAHALRLDLAAVHSAIGEGADAPTGSQRAPAEINAAASSHYPCGQTHLDSGRRYFAIRSAQLVDRHIPLVNLWRVSARVAYVINTILPYGELARLPEVVAAMTRGLAADTLQRVAIVLGVNGPEAAGEAVRAAVAQANGGLANLAVEVQLVPMTFRGSKFPYGTMRNTLMYSEATLSLVRHFAGLGWAPYLSFQDFDTGSRLLESGLHIFDDIDARLAEDESGGTQRPLMIAGGYRPQPRERLIAMTAARYPDHLMPQAHRQKLDAFEAAIREDMGIRVRYAALDPMLPYAPEPNLFIDGTLLLREGARPAFSPNGAEYEGLSSSLVACNRAELDAHFAPRFEAAGEAPVPVSRHPVAQPALLAPDREEIASQLEIASQTNRHPWRGISFLLDFTMTVETDLSRLAYSYLSKNKLPQLHNLTYLVTRLFQTRGDKKGVKLSEIRTRFDYEAAMAAAMEAGFEPVREFLERHRQELVGMEGARFADYFAQRFSEQGVFADRHYNVPPSHQAAFAYQVAIEPALAKRRRLE
ncbi:hypothetical protein [Aeromonas schubertii]|uniref:hypothetical protein n=1 Tax=Aeromonas schubertii TaxID=652 RepID=UPI0010A882A9|nr:hypothetical protein [Aeromonas schubertii]QCG47984.1 hypothetical protein E2P79_09150 [Aeromonas schubertii]